MRWSWDQSPITINKNMKNFKKTNRLERCLAQNFVSFMYLSATINSFSCGRLAYIRDFGQLAHVFFFLRYVVYSNWSEFGHKSSTIAEL